MARNPQRYHTENGVFLDISCNPWHKMAQRCWRFAQKSDCLGFLSKVIPIEPGFSSPRVHQAQLVYYRLCPSLSYNWLIDVDCWLWHLTGQQTYTNLVRSIYTPISDYEKTLHWSFGLAAALHPAGAAGPALCRNGSTHNRLPGDNDLPGAEGIGEGNGASTVGSNWLTSWMSEWCLDARCCCVLGWRCQFEATFEATFQA